MASVVLGLHSAVAQNPDPYGTLKSTPAGKAINRKKNWVEGVWENIAPEPVYIKDKYHLKQVCLEQEKITGRKLIPKAFMKPKSQGSGVEWSF